VILLWGPVDDGPFGAVRAALHDRGAAVAVVDQRRVVATRVDLRQGERTAGVVEVDGTVVALDEVGAVYWRSRDLREDVLTAAGMDDGALGRAWAVEDALLGWLDVTGATVVNRPAAMASNASKPYQLALLRDLGFDVPQTLVTTDPVAARAFWADHGAVVYKSISGIRSIVSQLGPAHQARLDAVVWCPTQFQQLVPGQDHRVHVVGDEVFATAVVSDADDYRYAGIDGDPAELRPVRLPDEVAARCVKATRSLGLVISGVDLRRAPDGRWYCFEVNPSPGFTYYEANTGQPIAAAIASLLIEADHGLASRPPRLSVRAPEP
jgi:glutathione synthase/RimK-type ligase-like ATP-grasp enzyme